MTLFKFTFEFSFYWLGHSQKFFCSIWIRVTFFLLFSFTSPLLLTSPHFNYFLFLLDQKSKSTVDFSAFLYIPVQHAFWLGYSHWWTTWNQAVSSSVLFPTSPEVVFIPSVKMAMSAETTKGIKLYFILLENYLEANGDIPLLFAFQVFDPLEKPHPLSRGLTSLHTQHYKKVYLNWRLVLKMPNRVFPMFHLVPNAWFGSSSHSPNIANFKPCESKRQLPFHFLLSRKTYKI